MFYYPKYTRPNQNSKCNIWVGSLVTFSYASRVSFVSDGSVEKSAASGHRGGKKTSVYVYCTYIYIQRERDFTVLNRKCSLKLFCMAMCNRIGFTVTDCVGVYKYLYFIYSFFSKKKNISFYRHCIFRTK